MKKLIMTHEGGMPLNLDQLRWLDNGINEALHAICRSLLPPGATSLVLEGCDITPVQNTDQFNVSDGWLYRHEGGGNICRVQAHTFSYQGAYPFPDTGLTPRWMDTTSFDASGSVTFHDGSNKQVHAVQEATVVVDDDPSSPAVVSVPGREGNWVPGTSISTRRQGDLLQIKGGYYGINGLFNETIPAGHRPTNDIRVPIAAFYQDNGDNYTPLLWIKASGQVTIIDTTHPSQSDVGYFINLSIPI
ncbi:MAG TPA: hypothetical protein VFC92_06480 [Bacteroidales bacterium]|nr:hypothetical protein [Bacteroidales bacterium]